VTADSRDLLALMRRRRSVRRFRPSPIAPATIRRLLEVARLAPSAHNRQPWRFVVIEDGAKRARLAEAMADRLRRDRLMDGDAPDVVAADAQRSMRRLSDAPCAILVCLTMESMDHYPDEHRNRAEHTMAVQSVAMAGENLLLAAAAEDLGACWLCGPLFAGDEARRALGLPPAWEPQGVVLLGEAEQVPAPRGRLSLDEIVRW